MRNYGKCTRMMQCEPRHEKTCYSCMPKQRCRPATGNIAADQRFVVATKMVLGHPKPKKMLIFRFVGIFEYIILLMLILFLDMCQNS